MSKIKEWLEEDKLILLEGWARDGLTEEQIAKNIGIDRTTLFRWKEKECNIYNAIKKGKEVVDFEVENALLKKCLGYNVLVRKCFKVKNVKYNDNGKKIEENEEIVVREEEMHVPADTTAQIFWLKNRKPKEWREKQEVLIDKNPIEDLTPLAELLNGNKDEFNTND